jgi:hypothetical protein
VPVTRVIDPGTRQRVLAHGQAIHPGGPKGIAHSCQPQPTQVEAESYERIEGSPIENHPGCGALGSRCAFVGLGDDLGRSALLETIGLKDPAASANALFEREAFGSRATFHG